MRMMSGGMDKGCDIEKVEGECFQKSVMVTMILLPQLIAIIGSITFTVRKVTHSMVPP